VCWSVVCAISPPPSANTQLSMPPAPAMHEGGSVSVNFRYRAGKEQSLGGGSQNHPSGSRELPDVGEHLLDHVGPVENGNFMIAPSGRPRAGCRTGSSAGSTGQPCACVRSDQVVKSRVGVAVA
jgi:hypothetical protein